MTHLNLLSLTVQSSSNLSFWVHLGTSRSLSMSGTSGDIDADSPRLCRYCSDIIPITLTEGHTTRSFHPSLAGLYHHSNSCDICRYLRKHFEQSDLAGLLDEAILHVRLKEPHLSDNGVRWAILEITVQTSSFEEHFSKSHAFSITTCPLSGTSEHTRSLFLHPH